MMFLHIVRYLAYMCICTCVCAWEYPCVCVCVLIVYSSSGENSIT